MTTSTVAAPRPHRKPLYFLLLTFLAPAVMAAWTLKSGWYVTMGTSNHGTLINPPVSLQDIPIEYPGNLSMEDRQKWKLLYVLPEPCTEACMNSLLAMRQIELAMGPEKLRLLSMIVATPPQRAALDALSPSFEPAPALTGIALANDIDHAFAPALSATPAPSTAGHLYLVDPTGTVFMFYPAISDPQASLLRGRDIIKDLKHAMKLSRVG